MANIFNKMFGKPQVEVKEEQRSIDEWINPVMGTLTLGGFASSYNSSKAMKLSTVYRAINVISDAIAVMPLDNYLIKDSWKYKQVNDLDYLLNVQPNPQMSAFVFKKLLVQNVITKGNAYIRIIRNTDQTIKSFELLDSDYMSVLINKTEVYYNSIMVTGVKEYLYTLNGKIYSEADIIHIMNTTNNGLVGISTVSAAALTLGIAYSSEEQASNFFEGGGNLSGILRPIAGVNISQEKAKNAKDNFINALNSSVGGKSGSIVVLDSGLEYQSISVSPKDAQLLESRQFNIINICQFFGVPPFKVFDLSKSSYASSEAAQIDFLNTTILSRIEAIEIEMYRKIFTRVEYSYTDLLFDVSKLLRLDAAAQATYFSQMFQLGAMTTNDIRSAINATTPVTGGNRAFIGVQVQPLDNLISEQKQMENNIDNNLE